MTRQIQTYFQDLAKTKRLESSDVEQRDDGTIDIRWSFEDIEVKISCPVEGLFVLSKADPGILGMLSRNALLGLYHKKISKPVKRHSERGAMKQTLSLFARIIHPWVAAQNRLPEAKQSDVFRQLIRADTTLQGKVEPAYITAWLVEHLAGEQVWNLYGLRRPTVKYGRFAHEYIYTHSEEGKQIKDFCAAIGFPQNDESFAYVERLVVMILQDFNNGL